MARNRIPIATYRLQFNRQFTFSDAAELVPYLHELGISHCYSSPYLRARAGSPHGYDIVNHNELNPEIGDATSFNRFMAVLREHGMGQVLDLVPNHMGVGGDDNAWWLDVLENGPSSLYARHFDIDWHPIKEELQGKILLPVLGAHYGTVLENGELRLGFDAQRGEFSIHYYSHRFPVNPESYPRILERDLAALSRQLGSDNEPLLELQSLITAFRHLPSYRENSDTKLEERRRDKEIHKKRLAELCARSRGIADYISQVVVAFNGQPDNPDSFDGLHKLLEQQVYRVAYWQVASDEINYRRFFDINDLAGLRMEEPEVFASTHGFVLNMVSEGRVDGLRIDHPDGLYDPRAYFRKLQQEVHAVLPAAEGEAPMEQAGTDFYLVVEKILASYEHLVQTWPVHGTTGYDFVNLVNGLFVNGAAETELDRVYSRFIGKRLNFDEVLYERKRLTVQTQLSSELTVLANMLDNIAQRNRHTRDFTFNGIRDAIMEVVACFPVYRTYVRDEEVSDDDRRYVEWAIAQAKKRSPATDISIFDFIHHILLNEVLHPKSTCREPALRFVMRFQQYTAPVMAKAMEDSAFYIYLRLVSLNEVGGDPRRFGSSVAAFHHANQDRLRHWPHAMLSTSSHDTKRGEDARVRIDVLSELVDEWRHRLTRWARLNRAKKRIVEGFPAPSRNDEYLLYQTLVGTWPLEPLNGRESCAYRDRIKAYMHKAVKEAKVMTSWINPNADYEDAVSHFVEALLNPSDHNAFLADFAPFARRVARFGLFNSLSQTLLKLTSPGVPDIYQGSELWDFSLVDPDNRRPVDYAKRRALLRALVAGWRRQPGEEFARGLVDTLEDGRAKLFLVWRVLQFRRRCRQLFDAGEYFPLVVQGPMAEHVCAFARRHAEQHMIVAVPRLHGLLMGDAGRFPVDAMIWTDTLLELPESISVQHFHSLLTGEHLQCEVRAGVALLPARELFAHFPVALLVCE